MQDRVDIVRVTCDVRPDVACQLQKDGVIGRVQGPGFIIREDGSLKVNASCDPSVRRKLMRVANELDQFSITGNDETFLMDNNTKRIKRLCIFDSMNVTPRVLDWLKDIKVDELLLSGPEHRLDFSRHHLIDHITHIGGILPIQCMPTTLMRISAEYMTRRFFIELLAALPNLYDVNAGIAIYTESNLLGLLGELMKHPSIGIVHQLELYFPVTEAVVSRVLDAIGFHPLLIQIGITEKCYRRLMDPDYDGGFGEQLPERISERFMIARKRRPLFYASQIIKGDLLCVLNEYLGL